MSWREVVVADFLKFRRESMTRAACSTYSATIPLVGQPADFHHAPSPFPCMRYGDLGGLASVQPISG
jgi:hypothetical protein